MNDLAFSYPNKQLCVVTCGEDKTIKVCLIISLFLKVWWGGASVLIIDVPLSAGVGCSQWSQAVYF